MVPALHHGWSDIPWELLLIDLQWSKVHIAEVFGGDKAVNN